MKRFIHLLAIVLPLLLLLSGCDFKSDTPICTHIDDDGNGKCDICYESVIVVIDFYAINDLHGKFKDTDSNVGVDELTTYLKQRYVLDDNVVLLSSGDMWQGSSESNLTKGLIITDWMNHLDFTSMTLGNHEYDWGEEYIEANEDIAEFPFLAINIFDKETNERVEYCDASVVIEREGIQIGIIGAIGDCYSSISGDKTEGVYFKKGYELTELVKAESERLRDDGVDYIVYSIHDGYGQTKKDETAISNEQIDDYYDAELSRGYVDLVFEGHSHQRYILVDEHGVKHAQGGGDNKSISHVEIEINSVNQSSRVTCAEYVANSVYSAHDDDPIVNELLKKYEDDIDIAEEVLGTVAKKKSSSEIKALVAELYYKEGLKRWGDSYDIVLGGGYISTRNPYDLSAGEVKYRDLQSLLPFDNQLVLCSVKGKDLLDKFINTDNKNYYIYMGQYGQNISGSIKNDETYYIITDKYSSEYAPNRLTVIEEYDPDVFARDLVADYIKNGGWKK